MRPSHADDCNFWLHDEHRRYSRTERHVICHGGRWNTGCRRRWQTTLAYTANAAGAGGTLTVSDGRHAAAISLLGNYVAGSFVTAADGHGGTLVTEASQTAQPQLLTQPRPG
jgi:hypothetical protein